MKEGETTTTFTSYCPKCDMETDIIEPHKKEERIIVMCINCEEDYFVRNPLFQAKEQVAETQTEQELEKKKVEAFNSLENGINIVGMEPEAIYKFLDNLTIRGDEGK